MATDSLAMICNKNPHSAAKQARVTRRRAARKHVDPTTIASITGPVKFENTQTQIKLDILAIIQGWVWTTASPNLLLRCSSHQLPSWSRCQGHRPDQSAHLAYKWDLDVMAWYWDVWVWIKVAKGCQTLKNARMLNFCSFVKFRYQIPKSVSNKGGGINLGINRRSRYIYG